MNSLTGNSHIFTENGMNYGIAQSSNLIKIYGFQCNRYSGIKDS